VPPPLDRPALLARRREIGDNLREARLAAGMTQERVALQAGIERPTLNRIEQGHAAARIDTLIQVSEVIGVDLGELMRRR
jgi:transcriptional regulator with XRE-family HTH domain